MKLFFCAILWHGTSGSIPWLDFVSLGKKVSGVLIFFPPPAQHHWSNKGLLPTSSLNPATFCLLPTGSILFPFLTPHGEAHRSSHIFTIPGPGWLIVWVGTPSRVIIPVSVKHFFFTDFWDWVAGWLPDQEYNFQISWKVSAPVSRWAIFIIFILWVQKTSVNCLAAALSFARFRCPDSADASKSGFLLFVVSLYIFIVSSMLEPIL